LKLHQSREKYDPAMPFLPWVFAITRNVLIDDVRKHRATPIDSEKLVAIADRRNREEDGVEGVTDWDEILRLLPEDQRNLLKMRFEEGLSFEDIAKRCGGNETSVRKRVSRTIQGIRKVLLGEGKGVRS
jgi:RNA polymerase sigma-70 factor (ECF subfamily)